MTTSRVVVIGDLLYDMLAKVEGAVALGTDTFTPIHAAPGGSGANAAAWLGTVGVETHFVGRVGDGVFGSSLAGELEEAGVEPHLVYDPSLETGKVFVGGDGTGERTMITDRGSGEALSPGDRPESRFCEGGRHRCGCVVAGRSRRER